MSASILCRHKASHFDHVTVHTDDHERTVRNESALEVLEPVLAFVLLRLIRRLIRSVARFLLGVVTHDFEVWLLDSGKTVVNASNANLSSGDSRVDRNRDSATDLAVSTSVSHAGIRTRSKNATFRKEARERKLKKPEFGGAEAKRQVSPRSIKLLELHVKGVDVRAKRQMGVLRLRVT